MAFLVEVGKAGGAQVAAVVARAAEALRAAVEGVAQLQRRGAV